MMELMVDARNTLGEGVLWCERTARVLWTDIEGAVLHAHDPATGHTRTWPMPERLACFALTDSDDRLLLGLATRLAFFDFSSGGITTICRVEEHLADTRINDGRCDRQGRFVFGTFNQAQPKTAIGSFYRLNADLTLERLALQKVAIANSICFSPDGGTMYYCDSMEKLIRSCQYGGPGGTLGEGRIFADLRGAEGEPDGSTVDADGYLWNALWGANKVVRYAPDGRVERELATPATQPSCVALGGAGFDTVYVTSARVGLEAALLAREPSNGGVFRAVQAGVRGLPEQRFLLRQDRH
ncbi:SMP-30/gluconolactonase/LRE family protein [Massilia sp. PAMC28688]|uniref:SMP-30/gluconolactonase/LRE family protein n=1 Tax=Massilia sp. PAMC28688 TaxID=2861283 RepID=UPI001C63442A|nr:SMP-30/gluconolactonase/LRE family protein [Massilia sp. PAMC28688]QYF93452.1 SMP-30/gluconolactonase/LRE family protein [Massilia sp. PAMC28688]